MQNACMTTITIRNVSKETHDELLSRAKCAGQSFQEYLRSQLDQIAAKPDLRTVLARIRTRKEQTGSRVSSEAILDARDADRR